MVSQVAEDSFPITYDGIYNPNASLFDGESEKHCIFQLTQSYGIQTLVMLTQP